MPVLPSSSSQVLARQAGSMATRAGAQLTAVISNWTTWPWVLRIRSLYSSEDTHPQDRSQRVKQIGTAPSLSFPTRKVDQFCLPAQVSRDRLHMWNFVPSTFQMWPAEFWQWRL